MLMVLHERVPSDVYTLWGKWSVVWVWSWLKVSFLSMCGLESGKAREGKREELREYREREERVYVSLRFRLLCICLAIPRVVIVLIMNCTLSHVGSSDLVRHWPAVRNQNKWDLMRLLNAKTTIQFIATNTTEEIT